jgi:hypothetical protein
MYAEVDFDSPQRLTSAVLLSHAPAYRPALHVYGQSLKGDWQLLSKSPEASQRPPRDLRLEAARALRTAGYRWILAPTGAGGNAPIGNQLVREAPQWGMEVAGDAGRFLLFHIK